jgi:predicted RNase H-like HicB family nuclease
VSLQSKDFIHHFLQTSTLEQHNATESAQNKDIYDEYKPPLLQLQPMAQMKLTAVYMKVPEGYVAFVEELPGANTQGETLDQARANLQESVAMVLEANRGLSEESLRGADVIREPLTIPAV